MSSFEKCLISYVKYEEVEYNKHVLESIFSDVTFLHMPMVCAFLEILPRVYGTYRSMPALNI